MCAVNIYYVYSINHLEFLLGSDNPFKVYFLEYLLYVLKNAVAQRQVWPAVSLSAEEISKDVYDFTIDIACEVRILLIL